MTQAGFEALIYEQAAAGSALASPALIPHLAAEARLEESYPRMLDRARAKLSIAEDRTRKATGAAEIGMPRHMLIEWHFNTRLKRPPPMDLGALARSLDLEDSETLLRLFAEEYLFVKINEAAPPEDPQATAEN